MVVIGGGATGVGHRRRCGLARLRRAPARAARLRQGHVEPQHEARARRRPLPRAGQHLARDGGAQGARHPAPERAAPGERPRLRRANYDWWEAPFYGIGLKVYNVLAGKYGFGDSQILSREETLARLPTIKTEGLRGGVVYYDGQFDDSRLLINLAQTAAEQGATLLNYARVDRRSRGRRTASSTASSRATRRPAARFARRREVVINATGPVRGRRAPPGGPDGAAADRAQPGRAPGVRPLVPARPERHHGAAHERRPRDVRDPLARPHARRHDRHADRRADARAARRSTRRSSSSSRPPASTCTARPRAPTC